MFNNSAMTKILGFLLIALLVLASGSALMVETGPHSAVAASSTDRPLDEAEFVPGEVLVKFKRGASPPAVQSILSAREATVLSEIEALGVKRLAVAEGQEWEVIEALRQHPLVEYAEPNYIARAMIVPDDPYFPSQWGLTKINAPQAWDITRGATNITIAIVDTGIDGSHEDLYGKVTAGYDFVNDRDIAANTNSDDCVYPCPYGHGTHVAGIAAAQTDNGIGVAGTSWGALLTPLKVLNAKGSGTYYNVARAITYAANHGVDIINLSLAGPDPSQELQDAVDYAYNKGCLLVAAGGNCSWECTHEVYPAGCEHVVAISATDEDDNRVGFSKYGDWVDVAAPGTEIYSTVPEGYEYKMGTSMSTPFVSGLAALVWPLYPDYCNDQMEGRIEQTALDLGDPHWDEYYGHGRIDAYEAICRPDLSVTPTDLRFLADDDIDPIPPHQTISLLSAGCWPITWTVSISPSGAASWLSLSPSSGTAAGASPGAISVSVTKPVTYGIYTATVIATSPMPYVQAKSRATNVELHYIPKLHREYLPIVTKEAVHFAPDLIVEDIIVTNPWLSADVEVTIKNQSTSPVTEEFWVDFYIDPRPPPSGVNQTWDDGRCYEGWAWGVVPPGIPLAAGQVMTLTYGGPYYDPWGQARFRGYFTLRNHALYAQVDSANILTTYGAVYETHEYLGGVYNNIKWILLSVGGAGGSSTSPGPRPADETPPSGNLPPRPVGGR